VLFLPVAMLQVNRLDELVDPEVDKGTKRKDVLDKLGFDDVSAVQQLMRQMATLTPLATAVLAKAFG